MINLDQAFSLPEQSRIFVVYTVFGIQGPRGATAR